jgi:hypothetical protein
MKRYIIPVGIVIIILLVGLIAYGQEKEQEKPPQRGASRQTIQNMTVEQKRLYQSQVRQRRGSSSFRTDQPEQLKAIEAIQEQLVKYKTAVQNVNREALLSYEKLSEQEKTKLTQNMTKSAYERQQALMIIEEKLPVIRGTRRTRTTEPLMPVRELKIIQQIAAREKATQTANRLELLIARYEKESAAPGTPAPAQTPQNRPGSERPARP